MSFVIENKKIDFDLIKVKDALNVKTAMLTLANENASNNEKIEAQKIIDSLAIQYVTIEINGEKTKINDIEVLNDIFKNPFVIVEITAQFQKVLQGFLEILPSFQNKK